MKEKDALTQRIISPSWKYSLLSENCKNREQMKLTYKEFEYFDERYPGKNEILSNWEEESMGHHLLEETLDGYLERTAYALQDHSPKNSNVSNPIKGFKMFCEFINDLDNQS